MKIHIKLLVLMLVALMLVQSTVFTASAFEPIDINSGIYQASGQPSKYSSQYNSGQRDVVATTLNGTSADSYYSGSYEYDVLSQKSASEIQTALATLMKSTHSYISSYDDCHYKANRTDCENEQGSSNKLSLIYTSYTATMSQWNGWNREHVWPKSLGGDTTSGGGADLHHIRPSDASVNSSRGNKKYGNSNGGTAKYGSNPASGYLGGYYNSTYFEPLDNVKGDVARICLYVYVRWGSSWGATSITKVFQSVDVLLEWMELDPVDTWELGRNEVVQDIQGNRNVFIDYPEYAWLIFGEEIPDDLATPSGEASGGGHTWNSGTVTTQATCTAAGVKTYTCTDSGCGATKTEAIAALGHSWSSGTVTTQATCVATGVKTYTCSRCNNTKTETIKALGHSYGDWIIDVEATESAAGSKHRECAACGNTENATIPMVGHTHSYSQTVTQPTCSEKGYTTHYCSCGDTYVDSYTNTTSHDYVGGRCVVCGYLDPDSGIKYYSASDFFNAVNSIASSTATGEARFAELREAVVIYNSLSDEDKSVVTSKYNTLKTYIQEYNDSCSVLNDEADEVSEEFVGVSTVSALALMFSLLGLLTKKYF